MSKFVFAVAFLSTLRQLSQYYRSYAYMTYCGGPFLRACVFLRFEVQKKGPFFVILFCSHSLEALEACLEACPDVFCSNFHGLATLEFKTCIEACLQLCFILYFLGLLQFR